MTTLKWNETIQTPQREESDRAERRARAFTALDEILLAHQGHWPAGDAELDMVLDRIHQWIADPDATSDLPADIEAHNA